MSEPRFITAAEVQQDIGNLKTATVVLTNAQIIALPTTNAILIPATETLNYDSFPTKLFSIVKAVLILDASAGAFTNVDGSNKISLGVGSDFSLTIGRVGNVGNDGTVTFSPLQSSDRSAYSVLIAEEFGGEFSYQDNAVVL